MINQSVLNLCTKTSNPVDQSDNDKYLFTKKMKIEKGILNGEFMCVGERLHILLARVYRNK